MTSPIKEGDTSYILPDSRKSIPKGAQKPAEVFQKAQKEQQAPSPSGSLAGSSRSVSSPKEPESAESTPPASPAQLTADAVEEVAAGRLELSHEEDPLARTIRSVIERNDEQFLGELFQQVVQDSAKEKRFHEAILHLREEDPQSNFLASLQDRFNNQGYLYSNLKRVVTGLTAVNNSAEQQKLLDTALGDFVCSRSEKANWLQIAKNDLENQSGPLASRQLLEGLISCLRSAGGRASFSPSTYLRFSQKFHSALTSGQLRELDRLLDFASRIFDMPREALISGQLQIHKGIDPTLLDLCKRYLDAVRTDMLPQQTPLWLFVRQQQLEQAIATIPDALAHGNMDAILRQLDLIVPSELPEDVVHDMLASHLGGCSLELHDALLSFGAFKAKAIEENRRSTPLELLKKSVIQAAATSLLRMAIVTAVESDSDYRLLQQQILPLQKYGVPVFALLEEEANYIAEPTLKGKFLQWCAQYRKGYEEEMQRRISYILSGHAENPKAGTEELHALIDELKANGLKARTFLEQAKAATDPAKAYLQRLLENFDALVSVPYEEHHLDPYELFRITCVAEFKLRHATGTDRLKATAPDVRLARSVILEPETRSYTIILGTHGSVLAEGSVGKVRSVIWVGDRVLLEVRKTQKLIENKRVPFDPKELKYTKMFMGLGSVVVYTRGACVKESLRMRRFDGDLAALLMQKGTKAFADDSEMLKAFYQVFQTLEKAHTNRDAKGALSPIVHGDVKPQNILYKKGILQLADWGFAVEVAKEKSRIPNHATPLYSTPEDLERQTKILSAEERIAIDMFAMGCILAHYISLSEQEAGRGHEGLWKKNGDPPWVGKLQVHFVKHKPQSIKEDVEAARTALSRVQHPLAPLAIALLHPDPKKRMTAPEATALLQAFLTPQPHFI